MTTSLLDGNINQQETLYSVQANMQINTTLDIAESFMPIVETTTERSVMYQFLANTKAFQMCGVVYYWGCGRKSG